MSTDAGGLDASTPETGAVTDATSPLDDGGETLDARVDAPHIDIPDAGPCNGLCGAGTVCEGGRCVPVDGGSTEDAQDGALPDGCTSSTTTDCCGRSCSSPSNFAVCRMGACVIEICGGYGADCDGDFANGCECQPAGAGGACRAGACVVGSCLPGLGNCDGNDTNGCESTLATDRANCGGCGTVCGDGLYCVAGACVACESPFMLCGGACVDPRTDRANCGACDAFCPPGRTCTAGMCR